jgi:hypothetical protein
MHHEEVIVVGAGQAGLAMGYWLRQQKRSFLLLEAGQRLGESWRTRYDSLVLFTPRRYSALPGLLLPGDPAGHPTKDEMADYLQAYADHFALPIQLQTPVVGLQLDGKTLQLLGSALTRPRHSLWQAWRSRMLNKMVDQLQQIVLIQGNHCGLPAITMHVLSRWQFTGTSGDSVPQHLGQRDQRVITGPHGQVVVRGQVFKWEVLESVFPYTAFHGSPLSR